ncbi:MAG: hypothetical protein B1H04_02300 [Planctomycetales bacterium 4484_123]|nr:MAG: hypothetical protein B1H04_02300 [Planctomycetales bacterium 4484_123]
MKYALTLLAVLGFACGLAWAQAQDPDGTLWQQEGTTNDGYDGINGREGGYNGPTGQPQDSWTNWKYQYGGGTWSAVYRKDGWLEISSSGDSKIDIECDIEMYYEESFSNNKIYFHLGNLYTATAADKTAIVDGSFRSNNGMYIGISFDGTSKTADDMLEDGSGNYTGEVKDAMVGTIDVLGRDISSESFNVKILLAWDGSGWQPPVDFGTGASGTILNTLWWLVNNGEKGSYNVQWKIELLPAEDQADGNYKFDPAVVAAPVL